MKKRIYVLPLLLLAALTVLWAGRDTAAFDTAYPGTARIDGPLRLDFAISDPISAPGETLLLTAQLQNQSKVIAAPSVAFHLPSGLRLTSTQIPSGMTVNLQTGALNWMPILPANGGQAQIEVPLRVETADLTQPAQSVTAVLRHEENEQTASAAIWIGLPPQINRILPLPQTAVGQPVQLLAEISGSGPISQSWLLGDGRRVDVNDPIVVFPSAGVYEITLEAKNPLTTVRETAVTQSAAIAIVPQPAAQFTPDDLTPGVGQSISFINLSGGQPPLIFRWDFGDGTTATGRQPSHQYAVPGTYDVHLTVENAHGQSEAFWPVTVGAPPIAAMEIADAAPAGEPISGQAFGDDTVTLYRWDMGDGAVYEGALVSHRYRQTGDFYVRMTAQNEFGGTEIGQWVHVGPGQFSTYLPLIVRFDEAAAGQKADPYELTLDPVELAEPFVMGPMAVPENSSQAAQLFLYINEARRQFGLPPLNFNPELSVAAQQHVGDMAGYGYTGHTGFDGSHPAERLLWLGYDAGYAGEATAWGFEYPYQAVEFWVNSPAHRRIILNQFATDVGVGFMVDYNAPNVWYWTAEFGNAYAAPPQPFVRLVGPEPETALMISEPLTFSWNWPLPLEPGQQFMVVRVDGETAVPLGAVNQPTVDTRYSFTMPASNDWSQVGAAQWQVVLEDAAGPLLVSELRPLTFLPDPDLPTPTPAATETAVATSTAAPTATPTPTPYIPETTPLPTPLPPPVIITATPSP